MQELKNLLSAKQNVVITTHVNPDGDAIGSSVALLNFLIKMGHDVSVIVPNDYPDFLKWMKMVLPNKSNESSYEGKVLIVSNMDPKLTKCQDIVDLFNSILPEFSHKETGKYLDQRM